MRMKKGTMLLLAIAVIASFLMIIALGGVEEPSSSVAESVAVELPEGFEPITQTQGEELYDTDQAVNKAADALGSIGAYGHLNFTFGNLDESELSTSIDLYVPTSKSNLIVNLLRLKTRQDCEWEVLSVRNADNKHFYYEREGSADLVDLYSYETDELVSKASKTFEEAESETAASVAAAEEEFEDQLDSIREKYGIAGSASAASSSGSSGFTLDVSELTFDGESIITSTEKDMREYDYIKDVTIQVDKDEIDIFVQVPSAVTEDTAKMAGEDVARYLAAQASWANDYYKQPGSDDIGSLYDRYTLMLYVDDGYKNFELITSISTMKEKALPTLLTCIATKPMSLSPKHPKPLRRLRAKPPRLLLLPKKNLKISSIPSEKSMELPVRPPLLPLPAPQALLLMSRS